MNIRKDAQQIQSATGMVINNALCLQDMGNVLSLKRCSLQHLSKDYIGMRLEKGRGHYVWDSSKRAFSHRSAEYAANDVISSLLVFRKMLNMPALERKHQLVINDSVQNTRILSNYENISNQTLFSVHIPRKIKNRPCSLDKTKYMEIIKRIMDVSQEKTVSFGKLVRIILYTCFAFPKDDPLARIKTRNVIFHLVDEGILVKK